MSMKLLNSNNSIFYRLKQGALMFRYFLLLLVFTSIKVYSDHMVIINDVDWPPYFFIDSTVDDQPIGLAKEMLNYCVVAQGYQIKYKRLPVKRTHHYMTTGDIDITVYSYKKSREEFLFYSHEPLFITDYGFMVRADSNIKVTELKDILPLRIGYIEGVSYTPELLKIIHEKELKGQASSGYSLVAMFAQLLAKTPRFDIIADAKSTFYWQAKRLGVLGKVKVLDFHLKQKSYYITVSKQSTIIKNPKDFLTKTDNCLKKLKSSGQYQQILAKYGQSY